MATDPNNPVPDPTQPSSATSPSSSTPPSSPSGNPPSTADLTQSAQTTPDTQAFDESKGVAGRVASLTQAGGSLFDAATARANAASAASGLLNSTQGIQAGQQAVIDTAVPIANADAGLYQQQQLTNQAAVNASRDANANRTTNIGLAGQSLAEQAASRVQAGNIAGQQLGESAREFNVGTATQAGQFGQSLAEQARQANQAAGVQTAGQQTQLQIANLDATSRQNLADTEAKWRTTIAGNQNIAQAWGTMQDEISRIQNNPDLDPGTKSTLIQNNINAFGQFAQFWQTASGTGADVSSLLNFGQGASGPQANYPAPTPAPNPPYDPNSTHG